MAPRNAPWSILAIAAADRLQQRRGVVTDPILEYDLDVLDVGDSLSRIALDHDDIRVLAGAERADAILEPQIAGTVERGDSHRLGHRESGLAQQLDLAHVAESRQHPAVSGWVGAG